MFRRHRTQDGEGGRQSAGFARYFGLRLILPLVVVIALAMLWFIWERLHDAREMIANVSTQNIVRIVELVENAPPGERRSVVAAFRSPRLRLWLTDREPKQIVDPDLSEMLEREVKNLVPGLEDRRIIVNPIFDRFSRKRWYRGPRMERDWNDRSDPAKDHRKHWDKYGRHKWQDEDDDDDDEDHHDEDAYDDRHTKVLLSVEIKGGSWLNFLIETNIKTWLGLAQLIILLLLIGGVVILFMMLVAHRAAKPLRRLAAAADRLGMDVDAPPLPETGPREMQRTAQAFNRMQGRIKTLIDDRTLMLGAMSHDLKTILTRLRLRTEMIDDDEQREKAAQDIDDMQVMVEAALSFLRGDQANEPVSKLDISALTRDLVADFALNAESAVTIDGPDRLVVRGRPVALKRAIGNLIENALRYGGETSVTLRQDGEIIVLEVCDSGPGIPEAELEKVFQPFYRRETSRNRETGGSGLGLSLARDIFRRLDGDLILENRPDGGLVARATLPSA